MEYHRGMQQLLHAIEQTHGAWRLSKNHVITSNTGVNYRTSSASRVYHEIGKRNLYPVTATNPHYQDHKTTYVFTQDEWYYPQSQGITNVSHIDSIVVRKDAITVDVLENNTPVSITVQVYTLAAGIRTKVYEETFPVDIIKEKVFFRHYNGQKEAVRLSADVELLNTGEVVIVRDTGFHTLFIPVFDNAQFVRFDRKDFQSREQFLQLIGKRGDVSVGTK
ncbi:hypothetical protein H6758_03870 [Candidatus Nomurabacteria bacterium]|nr:hypothetical protein [Candidatus Nomurabacteria bacterium]